MIPTEETGLLQQYYEGVRASGYSRQPISKMQKNYQTVLFDLDGTINDSGPGIMKSVQYALDRFGLKNEPESRLRKFVGPSLLYSFTTYYGMTEPEAMEAVRYYREYYPVKGIFDLTVYPGIREVMTRLQENGKKLILVTSKPHVLADRILEHFDLGKYFDYTTGPELNDHSSEKVRLIEQAIRACSLNRAEMIMVGDTHFDIDGAAAAGIDSIGVTYGYGTREELVRAGASYLADRAEEILPIVLPERK